MPVNMDPSKKRRRPGARARSAAEQEAETSPSEPTQRTFGEETPVDREKDLAEAELNNLWDATEVIDMDKF